MITSPNKKVMTQQKIIIKRNADFGEVADTLLFTVPAGQTFAPSEITFKRGATAPDKDGDGVFTIIKKSGVTETVIYTGDSVIIPGANAVANVPLSTSLVLNAGDTLRLKVTTPDSGAEAICDIEIVGISDGDSVSGDVTLYTDLATVASYTGKTFTEQEEDTVREYIKAMSLYIDAYCNRDIYRTEPATYRYDGDGSELLRISDVCDITEVTVDDVARSFTTYPQNKPYASRILIEDGYRFTKGRSNVTVTGIQAMSTTLPADVKQACTVLVAGILNAKDVQGKVGTTERIGAYSVTYKDEAQQTDFATAKTSLSAYRRIAL